MKNGQVAYYVDNESHGEDSYLTRIIDNDSCFDAVMDGLTDCEGDYASDFVAKTLATSHIKDFAGLISALDKANDALFLGGAGRSLLTTVSVTLKLDSQLHVVNAGDSPVYLIRNGGKQIMKLAAAIKSRILVTLMANVVGKHAAFKYEYHNQTLLPGDRLILATDGITNNLSVQDIGDIIGNSFTPEEACNKLKTSIESKRTQGLGLREFYGTFRDDDRTAIIRFFD